jgi:alpha-mannosidase
MKKSLLIFFILTLLWGRNSYAQKYDLSKVPVLYSVGYAHLDTEWRWDYQTTINEYIWNTMADNFRLFEKYPDYIFNFSGAIRYMLMKEYYPDEFEKVKKYVALGKWFPAGSSMEENDVLAPSHESMIRQILLGSNYFRKELGVTSNEFILPDCFGYLESLPSILAHCGIKGFSTQKLTWGSAVGIPFSVGKWVGVDGESVVAAINPGSYTSRVNSDLNNSEWINRTLEAGKKYGVGAEFMYYGTGDVGGSPTEGSVDWVTKSAKNSGKVKILSSTTAQMFDDITPALKDKLPVYKGEFLLTNHSAGSITSAGFMKKMNRKNELLAYKAEASSVIGEWLGTNEYNKDKMNSAWRLVMASQFHDILPGTSIPRAYDFAQNDEIVAANQFSAIFADASGAVVRAMNTNVKGVPVVVFNPLSFEREDCVEATVTFNEAPKSVKVYNQENDEVPSQVVSIDGNKVSLIFLAKTPSVSYTTFDVRPSEKKSAMSTGLKITASTMENSKYSVKINSGGDITSIYDKIAKKELLASPIRLAFQYERPEDYPAWNMDWADRKNPPTGYVDGMAKISIVENGPARVALEIEREARNSKFVEQIRLTAGGERVEFNTKIDWAAKETSLKATFPLTVSNYKATYNMGVGTIERGTNDSVKFEVPAHQWFDLTDKNGSYGVSVLDDCKYGSDKPSDSMVRLTLLYTPGTRGYYSDQAVQEFGHHEILYALYGHKGDWKNGSGKQALRINQPLVAFQTIAHDGYLGKEFSFVEINNPDVVLSALKKAEESDDIIVRFVETKGKDAKNVQVSFAKEIASAKEVNGQEQVLCDAAVKNGRLVFDATPYHLKTFAVKLKAADKQLTAAKTTPLEIPYNVDVISNDKHKADGNFGENGKTYPAEMLPDVITSENIKFKLGPKTDGMNNAVACAGQTIKLPAGNYNKLYLLAASSDKLNKGTFKVGGKEIEIPVEYWSGFLGQWDRRNWDNASVAETNYEKANVYFTGLTPAYLKKENVACFTSHRHSRSGENEAYVYAYIYKYKIDLPAGASEITLPENDRIKIFAITAAENENDNTIPAQNLFEDLSRNQNDFKRFTVSAKPQIIPEKGYIDYSKPLMVAISSADYNAEIHYTTDGTVPTANSPKYTDPFKVDRTTVVKVISFAKDKLPSTVITGVLSKSLPVKDVTYNVLPSQRRYGWERALVDLVEGTTEYGDRKWQNYEKGDVDVTFDLGEVKNVSEIVFRFLLKKDFRLFLPASVEISVSADNKDFVTVVKENITMPQKSEPVSIEKIPFNIKKEARYLRIKAVNIGTVPAGYKEAGANATISIDEITVK